MDSDWWALWPMGGSGSGGTCVVVVILQLPGTGARPAPRPQALPHTLYVPDRFWGNEEGILTT